MNSEPPTDEFGLIAWIRAQTGSASSGSTRLGIGDDCAILGVPDGTELLVTTDMLMDGRHFRLDEDGAEAVGYKALGVNLSDVAAMAGFPLAAVVAAALPRSHGVETAQSLHYGMNRLARRFQVDLVGGDTNAWDGPLIVSVTLIGKTAGRGAVRRSGARPGDAIFVTGPLGGSLLGRHLRPEPRLAEARALNEAVPLHALIDLSDGLSSDLGHVLKESGGLGAILDVDAIPIHDDARTMSRRDGRPPLEHALNDGEDFELCLTAAPNDAEKLAADPRLRDFLFRIGEITSEPGLRLCDRSGFIRPIAAGGFNHFRTGR